MEIAPVKEHAERAWEQLSERAVNIAGHAAHISEHAAHSKQARKLHHEAQRLEHTMERRLEKLAKRLPVETPVDRSRRSRSRRRAFETGAVVVVVAGAAVAAFVILRARRNAPPEFVQQLPDQPRQADADASHVGPRTDAPTREMSDTETADAKSETNGKSKSATPKP